MFNALDSSLFYLINEYFRNPIFDYILPFFSYSLPLLAGVCIFVFFFSVYCLKIYGDALWRVLALVITIGVSVGVSESGALLLKDTFERFRPYERLQHTFYFQENTYSWVEIVRDDLVGKSSELKVEESRVLAAEDGEKSQESIQNIATNIITPSEREQAQIGIQPEEQTEEQTEEQINAEQVVLLEESISQTAGAETVNVASQERVLNEQTSQEAVSQERAMKDVSLDKNSDENILDTIFISNPTGLSYDKLSYTVANEKGIFEETSASMPSAFAANVMAITFIIALLFPKMSPWIYFTPFITGWARIYTGNSFPMDIVIGWIWGILAVAIAWFICEFILRKIVKTRRI